MNKNVMYKILSILYNTATASPVMWEGLHFTSHLHDFTKRRC